MLRSHNRRPCPASKPALQELARRALALAALGLPADTDVQGLVHTSPWLYTQDQPKFFQELGRTPPGPLTRALVHAWREPMERPMPEVATKVAASHAHALQAAYEALQAAYKAQRQAPDQDPAALARINRFHARLNALPAPPPNPLAGTGLAFSPATTLSTLRHSKELGVIHSPESDDGYRPAGDSMGWIHKASPTHEHPEGLDLVTLQALRDRLDVYAELHAADDAARADLSAAFNAANRKKVGAEQLRAAVMDAAAAISELAAL